MKREFLEEALQEIGDEHIAEAAQVGEVKTENAERTMTQTTKAIQNKKHDGKKRKSLWKPAVALATAAAVLAVVIFGGGEWWNVVKNPGESPVLKAHAIGEVVYPEMSPYPNERKYIQANGEFDSAAFNVVYDAWREDQKAQRNQPEGYTEGADQFAALTIPQFLRGAGTENMIYSPLNAYMALSMAAELTDGQGRQQLLDLLGAESIEALRWKASAVWNAHYCNDGATSSVLASSLWLDDTVDYNADTVKALAENYYASSYRGDLQSAEMTDALKAWLNQQTGGLLEEYVEAIEIDPETILSLATTVYFREKWNDEFSASRTETDVFHALTGDVNSEFMYQCPDQNYFWAEKFGATYKYLENGDYMWFILPDEGVTVDDVLADSEFTDFLEERSDWENRKRVIIHFYLPKFDASSKMDLTDGLKSLGVTDIFTPGAADFTPIAEGLQDAYFSEVQHAVRVAVDEEGVTAAAYTAMMEAGAAEPPTEEIEFKLDRPFIFAITGHDGLPLFVGVVNQP